MGTRAVPFRARRLWRFACTSHWRARSVGRARVCKRRFVRVLKMRLILICASLALLVPAVGTAAGSSRLSERAAKHVLRLNLARGYGIQHVRASCHRRSASKFACGWGGGGGGPNRRRRGRGGPARKRARGQGPGGERGYPAPAPRPRDRARP